RGLLQTHKQPLLGFVFAEVNERGGVIFREIVQPGFNYGRGVVAHGEGHALRFLIDRAVNGLGFIGHGVGIISSQRAFLVHRELNGHVRRRGVGLGEREYAKGQPIAIGRRLGRGSLAGKISSLRVILLGSALILAVHVDAAIVVGNVVAVIVVDGLRV